jgi:hypothetical protein
MHLYFASLILNLTLTVLKHAAERQGAGHVLA